MQILLLLVRFLETQSKVTSLIQFFVRRVLQATHQLDKNHSILFAFQYQLSKKTQKSTSLAPLFLNNTWVQFPNLQLTIKVHQKVLEECVPPHLQFPPLLLRLALVHTFLYNQYNHPRFLSICRKTSPSVKTNTVLRKITDQYHIYKVKHINGLPVESIVQIETKLHNNALKGIACGF